MPAPNSYSPMYSPYNPYAQMTPVQPQNNGIIWIQGESAAKSYPVQPGTSVLLMDMDDDVFYIRSSDNSGMPQKLRKFRYTEMTEEVVVPKPSQEPSQFITREEFDRKIAELSKPHFNNKGNYKKEEKVNE